MTSTKKIEYCKRSIFLLKPLHARPSRSHTPKKKELQDNSKQKRLSFSK